MKLDIVKLVKVKLLNLSEDASIADDEIRHKMMFFIIIIPGFIFINVLGAFAIWEEEFFLGGADFIISAISLTLFILARIDYHFRKLIIILYVIMVLFFLFLFTLGLARNQSFVWYYTIPILSFFFFGKDTGLLLSLGVLVISIFIASIQAHLPFYSPYPEGFLFRFFFSYFAETILVYIFELTRQATKNKLESTLATLHRETIQDALTNLYNRRYLDNLLDMLCMRNNQKQSLTFMMADIDFFKQYNDTYGHQAGDIVLQKIAEVLQQTTRRESDYAFRYGGEEFSILLNQSSVDVAKEIAAQIRSSVEALAIPHEKSNYELITISIGIVHVYEGGKLDKGDLVDIADTALYEVKESGRNNYKIKVIK